MFTNLIVDNFKCFSTPFSFELGKVNIFTGYNGRGKSTVFQVLLLIAQSLYDNRNLNDLMVNGIFCKLGLFQELLNYTTKDKSVHFTLATNRKDNFRTIELSYEEKTARKGKLSEIKIDDTSYFERRKSIGGEKTSEESTLGVYPTDVHKLFDNFQFVAADRLGPTPHEEKNDLYGHNPIGNSGEFKLNVLAGNDGLKQELASAISRIMDGGDMTMTGDKEKTDELLKLYFSTMDGNHTVKSVNSGFGYSYMIPILLSAMTMKKDGCLFVENPEAHLHPCAQSKLMQELIRIVLERNIQLFIETHSEHVINAMRLCVLYEDVYKDFCHSDVSVYFFNKDMNIKKLEVYPNAQMPEWPNGFFDQAERDAARILQLGLLK